MCSELHLHVAIDGQLGHLIHSTPDVVTQSTSSPFVLLVLFRHPVCAS